MIIDKKHRKCESLPNQDCPYGPHSCTRALGHLRRRRQSKRAGSSPSGAPAREPGRWTGQRRWTARWWSPWQPARAHALGCGAPRAPKDRPQHPRAARATRVSRGRDKGATARGGS